MRSVACATASSSTTGRTAPAKVAQLDDRLLRITIHEGRNRQVRRMCDAVGHPVRCGSCARGSARSPTATLAPGAWRSLTQDEVRALERAAVGERSRR